MVWTHCILLRLLFLVLFASPPPNTAPTTFLRMEFFTAVLGARGPKLAPLFALLSLVAVLSLSTLLSGLYPVARAPLQTSTVPVPANYTSPHVTPVLPPRNIRLKKNQTSVVKDVSLLKNFRGRVGRGGKRCDLFDGRWVVDKSRPIYKPGSCPYIDSAFDCYKNGRTDLDYTKLRWQPKGCKMPRFNGSRMLEILRGKRLVFVGDSLNRNMWQSLVCMLRSSVRNEKRAYEISGRREFRTEGSYSIKFVDYNCTVEFFRTPFLVQEWQSPDSRGMPRETLRLDIVHNSSTRVKDADFIVFNTAHWWTHTKTSRGKGFYQEGDHVYSQLSALDAYRKALTTWAKWVDQTIDRKRTRVFFRGYSASHFSGGRWNSGGNCDGETLPVTNDTQLGKYPRMMTVFESVMEHVSVPVHFLNITRMTDYRKDAHPSVFRFPPAQRKPGGHQDCSHWCLPGVPDAWNEILYAILLLPRTMTTTTTRKGAHARNNRRGPA